MNKLTKILYLVLILIINPDKNLYSETYNLDWLFNKLFLSFSERLKKYGVVVGFLSRFVSSSDAKKTIGQINGLFPYCYFIFNGARYRILKALLSSSMGKPGHVLNEHLEIACGNNSIKILEIQREGKKSQKINEFILGTKIKKGSNLNNV